MRVIAGEARGRRLKSPKGMQVRPTIDRVKEALFNIIGTGIYEARFLDLYGGTGSIGIEALSRGARQSVFVEREPRNVKLIRENLTLCKCIEHSQIYQCSVQEALNRLGASSEQFDYIWLDPPYGKQLIEPTIEGIVMHRLLVPGGIVIAEHGRREEIYRIIKGLECFRQNNYGDTTLSFFHVADKEVSNEDSGLPR